MPICHNCGAPVGVEGVWGCPNCIKGWEKLYRNSSKGVLKMDCSKTADFLMEWKRLCSSRLCHTGEKCPMLFFCDIATEKFHDAIIKDAIEALQKWSDEHPRKTYAQDFFEKFPSALSALKSGDIPSICRCQVYGGKCELGFECIECWNEPMDD